MTGLDHRRRRGGEGLLGRHLGLRAGGERVLVAGQAGRHRPAVGAGGAALALEGGQVAPGRHARDAELALQRRDGDAALLAQAPGDQPAAVRGERCCSLLSVADGPRPMAHKVTQRYSIRRRVCNHPHQCASPSS